MKEYFKKSQRFVALVLTVLVAFTMMPVNSFAATTNRGIALEGSDRDSAQATTYTVSGTIKGSDTKKEISKATVTLKKGTKTVDSMKTTTAGTYKFTKIAKATGYTVTVSAAGYTTYKSPAFSVAKSLTKSANLTSSLKVAGVVKNSDGKEVSGVTVSLKKGTAKAVTATTNASGAYTFTQVARGTDYTVSAQAAGYKTTAASKLTVNGNEVKNITLSFQPSKVTYNKNGATGGTAPSDTASYKIGATVTVKTKGSLVKTGYTFSHWDTKADGSGTDRKPASTFKMGTASVTLYAVWTKNPTPTVTKVEVTPATATIAATGGIKEFTAKVTGTNSPAETVKWSISGTELNALTTINETTGLLTVNAADAGKTITVTATSTVDTAVSGTAIVTVEAVAVAKFTVTFNANGGAPVPNAVEVEKDAKVTKPPVDPTKEGFTFAGWYKDEALTTAWAFDTDVVTAPVTLNAKWTANIADISAITWGTVVAPALDAVPSATYAVGASATNHTGAVVWAPVAAKFAAATTYTATVTLTAADGSKFKDGFAATDITGFPVKGTAPYTDVTFAPSTDNGKTIVATIVYDKIVAAKLKITAITVVTSSKVEVTTEDTAGKIIDKDDFVVSVAGVNIPAGTGSNTFSVAKVSDTKFAITLNTAMKNAEEIIVTGESDLGESVKVKYFETFIVAASHAVIASNATNTAAGTPSIAANAEGAVVTVKKSADLSVVGTTTVDADGKFKFSVAPGTYNVEISKTGYQTNTIYGLKVVSTGTGAANTEVAAADIELLSTSTDLVVSDASVAVLDADGTTIKVLEGKTGDELDAALKLKVGPTAAASILVKKSDDAAALVVGAVTLAATNKVVVTPQAGEPAKTYSIVLIKASEITVSKVALSKGTSVGTAKIDSTTAGQKYKINSGAEVAISGSSVDNIEVKVGDVITVWEGTDATAAGKFKALTVTAAEIKGDAAPVVLGARAKQGGSIKVTSIPVMYGFKLQISKSTVAPYVYYDLTYTANASTATLPTVVPEGTYKMYKLHVASGAISDASTNSFVVDNVAPTLTVGTTERKSDSAADITIQASEKGEYYYQVSTAMPVFTDDVMGTPLSANTDAKISLANLTVGEKTVWVAVKDDAGNFSAAKSVTIAAYSQNVKQTTTVNGYVIVADASGVNEANKIHLDKTNNVITAQASTDGLTYNVTATAKNYSAVATLIASLEVGDAFGIDASGLISSIVLKDTPVVDKTITLSNAASASIVTITSNNTNTNAKKVTVAFADAFTKKVLVKGNASAFRADGSSYFVIDPANFAGDLEQAETAVLTIPANKILNIKTGKVLTVEDSGGVINYGTVNVESGGTLHSASAGGVRMKDLTGSAPTAVPSGKLVINAGGVVFDTIAYINNGGRIDLSVAGSTITMSGDDTAEAQGVKGPKFKITGTASVTNGNPLYVWPTQELIVDSNSTVFVLESAKLVLKSGAKLQLDGTIQVKTTGKLEIAAPKTIANDATHAGKIVFLTGAEYKVNGVSALNGTAPLVKNVGPIEIRQTSISGTKLMEYVIPENSKLQVLDSLVGDSDRFVNNGTIEFTGDNKEIEGIVVAGSKSTITTTAGKTGSIINKLLVNSADTELTVAGAGVKVRLFGGSGTIKSMTGAPKVLKYLGIADGTSKEATAADMAVIPSFMAALQAKSVTVAETGTLRVGQGNEEAINVSGTNITPQYASKTLTLSQGDYALLDSNKYVGIHNMFVLTTPTNTNLLAGDPDSAVVLRSEEGGTLTAPAYRMFVQGVDHEVNGDDMDKFFVIMKGKTFKKANTLIALYAGNQYLGTVEFNVDWSAVSGN